jgi:hypothetical protein
MHRLKRPGTTRAMRSQIAVVTALSLLCACGGSKPTTEQPTLDFPDAAPSSAADARVAVAPPPDAAPPAPKTFTIPAAPLKSARLTKGKGKAAVLRYAFADGSGQVVDTTLDVEIDVTAQGQTQHQVAPTQNIGRVVEVTGVDAQGTAMVRVTMDRGSAADAAMTETLEQLKGTVLDGSVDARGRAGDLSITSIAQDDASARTIAGLLEYRSRVVVLPEEPIGTGGTWQVTTNDNVNGIQSEVTTTYKLVKREANAWTITGVIKAVAQPQQIPAEALGGGPGSAPIDVKSMTGTGTLTITVDPTKPAPTSEFNESYDAVMSVEVQDRAGTRVRQDVQITSKIVARQTTRAR